MTKLLVASRNRKKLAELRRVLDGAGLSGLTLLSLGDVSPLPETPETGVTFEDNALAKARDAFSATGLASVADDSGLEVAALGGMPGVLSARWSGRYGDDAANTALLLAQLCDVPDERRGAAFVSACALVSGSGEVVVRGEWPGTIAREPRGDGGFGYDPVFVPYGDDRTAAQLSPGGKGRGIPSRSRVGSAAAGAALPGDRLKPEAGLDLFGLEVLDDDAEQRNCAGEQNTGCFAERPADLDRQVQRQKQIREVHPAVHHTDPRRRIVNLDDVADHDLVAQCDEPEARRPRHDPVAEQSGANPLDGDGRLGVLRRGRFGCGHAVVLFCFLASSLASSAR